MNGISHYFVGVILTVFIIKFVNRNEDEEFQMKPNLIVVIIIVTTISHVFVDAFAHLTYHPSESDWSNPIYTGWHLLTYFAEAISAIYLLRTDIRLAYGMIGSVVFDLWDWSIRRGLGFESLPSVHWMADGMEDLLFGWWMRSLRNDQWALIIEVIVVITMIVYWKKIYPKSIIANNPKPATNLELFLLLLIVGSLRLLTLV